VNKIVKKVCNAFALIWITIILLNTFSIHSYAKSETMTYKFSKDTEQYRSKTITIPGLVNITSVTVDTGNVTYSVSGNNVTITCRNGNYVDYDEESDYIGNYSYNTKENYPPDRYYYSHNGYSGYLYLQSTDNEGYYEFKEESKEFLKIQDNTRTDYYDANGNFLLTTYSLGSSDNPTMYVNENGYEGYIPKYSFDTIQPRTRYDNPDGSYRFETTWRAYYIGTLTKTTPIWHDNYTGYYSGYVYGDTIYYYAYNVTINYVTNTSPSISIVSPTQGMIFSETSTSFVPVIAVSDPDGDTLTCKVFIDSETSPRDSKTISNTQTTQNVSFNALNLGSLSQGTHTMKFTVKDSEMTQQASISFKVDKTLPTLGSVNIASATDAITISGSATDNMAMHDTPYRYYAGSNDSSWKTSGSHTFTNLSPNTQYQVKFVARDKVGHLSEKVQNVYTKALKPVISVGNANETSLVVSFSENNPSGTQYLISCGSKYVNAQGKLTSTPVWITPQGKSITVSDLSPNTSYTFTVKARNGDSIETEASDAKSGKTLAMPPQILEFPEIKQNSIKIVWSAVSGATGYDIEVDGHVINNGLSTTYTHSGLQPETTHTYRVRVKNAGGTGNWSALFSQSTLMGNPGLPVNINYTFTRTQVTLTWDAALKASGYDVEVDGVVQDNRSSRTYTHYGLEPESTHTYRVRAKNSGGYSNWSNYIQVTTLPNPPVPPQQVSTVITKNTIQIEWEPNIKADRYEIEVDGFIYNNGTSTKYLHKNLVPLTTHQYRIRGVNAGGTGAWSQTFIFTTYPYEPYIPENVMASSDRNSVTLTWYMAAYASSYEIEIDGHSIVEAEEPFYEHGNLLPGTNHTYRIRSKNITGVSDWTSPVSISTSMDTGSAVTAITNVAAIVTTDSIVLSWDAAAVYCEYEIEVDGNLLNNGSNTVFSHTGLLPGSYHEYRIRVKNTEQPNDWCVVLTVSSLPEPPGRTNISDYYATNNSIQIWWEPVEGAVSYDIEADGELLANVTDITCIHKSLLPGTAHQYRVRARTLLDVSPWSGLLEFSTSTTTFEVVCPEGETFDYTLLAINVQDFSNVKYIVTFNENDLEIVDLCTFTPADDTMMNGIIPGTNLTVSRTDGKIEFTVAENIAPGTCWSGELTTVRFRSKTDNRTYIDFAEKMD